MASKTSRDFRITQEPDKGCKTRGRSYSHLSCHDKWSDTTIDSKNGLCPCTIFTYKQEEAAASAHALAGQ